MSQVLQRCVSHLEVVEGYLRRPDTRLTWHGTPLSERNHKFVLDLYVLMSCIWYSASSSPDLLNRRWTQALLGADVAEVVEAFKSIDQRLIRGIDGPASFNRWRRSTYPFMGQILGPLKDDVDTFLSDRVGLRKLRTCFLFITRANFPDPIGLEEAAWDDWKERNLRPVDIIDLGPEARTIREIFSRIRVPEPFKPRFGPGQTSDLGKATDLEAKYLCFRDDPLLRLFAERVSFPTSAMPFRRDGLIRVGELRFVPKQLDKMRVITAEPSSLMFYQQGVSSWMLECIRTSPWRKHIDLRRADLNQELAWEGSISGDYATIDLSNASDCVRDWMVRTLFYDTPFRLALRATRSRGVEYNSEIYSPAYFAPMGSACCFPVETAVFSAIVESTMRENRDRRAWRAYGDDLIVPTERYDQVISRLEDLGFSVNTEKSFTGRCPFRESCGGDYFQGEDVTPIRVSRRWSGLTADPKVVSTVEGNVDLANRLVHFPFARLRVIRALKAVRPPVLFNDTGDGGVWSKDPSNHHARVRYNPDLQGWEARVGQVSARPIRGNPDIGLFEWLRARELDDSPVTESYISVGPAKSPIWRPKWAQPYPGWVPE